MMRLIILSLLAILLVSGNVFAQNINIRGKVVDKSGEPLIGVTVVIQGTRTGVATELDGTYSISAPANAALLFTAIGMEDLVEQVNNRSVINVTMNESSIFLEDVVVTA
ncbi:MAG: carboxypeptidase-like regulatory domain-containing protein, partial [Bacteroidales bacterium]|nr:carboxypeptidase-like regulatory domain-containing protein [Bacteroidales bacterium]